MTRRQLIKLLALGVGNLDLDLDSLLWVPGQKKIFVADVPKGMTASQICAVELERILPYMKRLFEQDSLFYEVLMKESYLLTEREFNVPVELKPGNYKKETIH